MRIRPRAGPIQGVLTMICKRRTAAGRSARTPARQRKTGMIAILMVGVIGAGGLLLARCFGTAGRSPLPPELEAYAQAHGLALSDYPEELVRLYEKNPETRDFVFNYPLKKNTNGPIDLSEYRNTGEIPLLMQWDPRWGYTRYAGELFGLSGCGPTCLSMAAIYLTGDTSLNPAAIGAFAQRNGYASHGNGSKWLLFSEGAAKLGLDAVELPLDRDRIVRNVEAGNPVVCVVGPGDFTTTGHFLVLSGWEDGKFRVHDPNSYGNSRRLWSYEELQGQIRNIWALRKTGG